MTKKTIKAFEDLGLGSKATAGGYRALNKDGSFNVTKSNVQLKESLNVFHSLISMSWAKFITLVVLAYLMVNLLFATIYILIGVENLTAVKGSNGLSDFLEAFFFSAQTITTLGYGRVAPVGEVANTVAAIESMLGLLRFMMLVTRKTHKRLVLIAISIAICMSGCVGLFDAGAWRPVPPFKFKRDSIPDSLGQSGNLGFIDIEKLKN